MYAPIPPVMGPSDTGSSFTALVILAGIAALLVIVIVSAWTRIRSRRPHVEAADNPSLPRAA
jgi:hypothetical protein